MPPPASLDVAVVLERASAPLAIVDVASLWVEAANEAFATLVRVPRSSVAGMSLLSFMPASELDALVGVFGGVAAGLVSLSQGRGSWGRDAHEVEVTWWARPFAGVRSDRLALSAVANNGAGPRVMPLPGQEAFVPGEAAIAQLALDHRGRIEEVSLNAEVLLGWRRSELLGVLVQACVHPDDIPAMLLVLGRASTEGRAVAAPLRIRNGYGGLTTLGFAACALCEHNPPRFAIAIWALPASGRTDVQGEPGLDPPGRYATPSGPRELSARQVAIMRRLAAGERVPTIARALGIANSTVRNHLAVIYRRFGVHSQAELMELLVRERTTGESLVGNGERRV
jgi:PAS domain S-box-containing protein